MLVRGEGSAKLFLGRGSGLISRREVANDVALEANF